MVEQESPSSQAEPQRKERRPLAVVNDVLDDKYRLLRPLKRGSMGAVFAAENLRLGVPVAVKVVRADVNQDAKAELAERMVQEAHAAFQVDHPAIMRVLDVGTTVGGDPYVVMELLRGETLAAALADHGPVEPTQAIRVLLPIAHALVAAHACNVVHRDIKPTNVFIARTTDGRVQPKLIDFGLAKARLPTGKRITQAGNTMGSPAYMAPEQIRGEDVTGQADVWGFCVTLYELLTGASPFQADELEVLFTHILFDPPQPLRDFNLNDNDLWKIIAKGLEKEPDERWQGMRELGAALAEWLIERGFTDDVCNASLPSTWLQAPRIPGKIDVLATAPTPLVRKASRIRVPSISELTTGEWIRAKRPGRRWLYGVLLLLTVTGVAAAVAAYLRVPLPGLPAHWMDGLRAPSTEPPGSSPAPVPRSVPTDADEAPSGR